MPIGGVLAGVLVTAAGLAPALLACGAAYFLATMLPAVRKEWREIDQRGGPSASRPEPAATGG